MRRRTVLAAGAIAAAGARASGVLRIVVAYPPGGVSDRVARLLARQLTHRLDKPVIVDNQPGAGGSVALAGLARTAAAALGDTLVFSAVTPLALAPHLGQAAPAVAPVCGIMHTPVLLLGTDALAARSFPEMLQAARARPGALRWATSGAATLGHLVLEQVRAGFGLDVVHVPYSGGGPQLQDALAGRFELLSSNLAPLQIEYVHAGRLHALAVGAPARSSLLPAVPTFAELGCPGANLASLFGLFAPVGTPAARIAQLNAACAAALAEPELRNALLDSGNLPASGSAAAFAQEIALQSAGFARAVAAMRR
jgi:tripartite-type tricarboxylate transporter receptor subunit TctC